MSSKRKRGDIFFDPNASDPEDEDFDPSENRPSRNPKKARPSRSSRPSGTSRRRDRYRGSDIDEDDDDLAPDSEDGSFIEDSEDENAPVNAAGRKARKVTSKSTNYRESSDDEEAEFSASDNDDGNDEVAHDLDDEDARPSRQTRKVVRLKVSGNALSQIPRRSTRANTEDQEDLVELSNSGHHAVPSRDSRSRSPDLVQRRSSRAMKGIKAPPDTIEEATQESSVRKVTDDDLDELAPEFDNDIKPSADEAVADDTVAIEDDVEESKEIVESLPVLDEDEDEDDDDVQFGRRTRGSRGNIAAQEDVESDATPKPGNRRLTRKSKRHTHEPSSDWEPDDDADNAASDAENMEIENDPASPTPAARSRGRSARSGTRSAGGRPESGDEDLDLDELHEEAQELRQSSRPRRRRTESPGIVYHERRQRNKVNYYMPPLTAANIEDDEMAEDPGPTAARSRRRGGASTTWDRSLNTTFGPFGGGGGVGSLLNGPWGSGATGGVDSDSSDDEMVHRSSIAGNPGMTPTSAAPGGLLPGAFGGGGLNAEGLGATPNVGKIKDRKALADADPLGVDLNVDFSKVGGLQGHIDQLKEMVQLPLLYPELFTRFHVTPPRGVLFHGPPGTGKTLLARALANSVGSGGRKISFYMRKGADALSKWVGEAEKQLRLLFEEARKTQPSIIFFDEIDGLAPVRSSKQEQIHASIVSTLLALMDGMDGRGQVIVIGATNRPDNIDPALRRPGRFDREFYFPLPDIDGRRSILDIHTKDWGLSEKFKTSLAEQTKGYGGADLRALCTEAALNAIQRTYPQIYSSQEKLVVDPSKIDVHASDFMISIKKLVPSSERSTTSVARPLPNAVAPLLSAQLANIKRGLDLLLPRKKKVTALEEAMYEQYDDDDHGFGREALAQEFERSRIFRPRYLICGSEGMGHGYIASAILHYLEGVHVQNFDLPSLLADGRPMEQVIVGLFTEVRRHKPSIIFIPNVDEWFAVLKDSIAFVTFKSILRSIAPTEPILLLATAETRKDDLARTELVRELFGFSAKNCMEIEKPNKANRREFFESTLNNIKLRPEQFPHPENRKKRVLEELPVAPTAAPKAPTKAEIKAQKKRDHQLLNALKVQLQPIMDQINRKYKKFRQPVIPQQQIDYLFVESDPNFVRPDVSQDQMRPFEVVKDKHGNDVLRDTISGKTYYNLETTTIEERLSNGFYARPKDFLFDIKALAKDAKNAGDKERTLKANELLSNVEVDVASIENSAANIDWEGLFQRQLQRAKDAAEKERKKKAMQSILDRVQSDVGGGNDTDSQGPVTLGVEVPNTHTMTRFQVRSPLAKEHADGNLEQAPLSNGTPQGPKPEDVQMSGVGMDTQDLSPANTMPPPPKSQEQFSGMHTGMTQISQKSAVMSLPPGVSPSAVINDASTTKTSDPSTHQSSNFSTQQTNGHGAGDAASLPDTLPPGGQPGPSQSSSGRSWLHSQAHAMKRGTLPSTLESSPSNSDPSLHVKDTPNHSSILGSSADEQVAPSVGGSQPQPDVTAEVQALVNNVVQATSGCTVEQLEQVNRELMDAIWNNRGEWSKALLCGVVKDVINSTISDIEQMQNIGEQSQE